MSARESGPGMRRGVLHALVISTLITLLAGVVPAPAQSQDGAGKPFIMPVSGAPGPSTWIVGQPYGNTTGAFVSGARQYSAGQYLHFGVDISMACGTPLVAVADGVVGSVDNPYRGSAPHNLTLNFPEPGLSVLYGHLLERPSLVEGQSVQQGEVVALSGDPDETCEGRPHLHLEVRSLDQSTAYNPILYIDAPWHSLIGMNSRTGPIFQRDLTAPRRWMSLEDQPDVVFGGRRLNDYTQTWPAPGQRGGPEPALPARPFTPASHTWTLSQLGSGGCCAGAWWHPTDASRLRFIDGTPGQVAQVFEVALDDRQRAATLYPAPPPVTSADGTHVVIAEEGRTVIRRLTDGAEWVLPIDDDTPSLSPDNQLVLWTEGDAGQREIHVGPVDGSSNSVVWASQERRASARWIDSRRLLISERAPVPGRYTTLSVANLDDGTSYPLGTWHSVRNVQIAPGGERLIFFSTFNPDSSLDGAYALEIAPSVPPERLPWFGDYRWRDSESVYYITYDPATDIQRLNFYHVPSGEAYPLTDPQQMPFTIANGDWSISPDGSAIAFQEARDGNLWLLEAH